ncbi:MAG: stage II sporulation protein P [Syntrophomonadaceae bacterium]|nr:stage II sporulation protein P [Syntrophomonadaceae bacterium]
MRQNNIIVFFRSILFIQLFVFITVIGISIDFNAMAGSWESSNGINWPFRIIGVNLDEKNSTALLGNVNVSMAGQVKSGGFNNYLQQGLARDLMVNALPSLSYKDDEINDPVVENNYPGKYAVPAIKNPDEEPLNKELLNAAFGNRPVVFYCTHNGETYIPDSGQARFNAEKGLINLVAEELSKNIGKKGISSCFYDRVHDFPDYDRSYTESRQTVKEILEKENNPLAIFDIHRDSIPGMDKARTVKVKERMSAQILIIVGTDERKSHPDWQKNHAFAQRLYEVGQQMYPGLIKGVRTKAGTYNQEYHPYALLLEFGTDQNKLEEVLYAGELFSDILVEVLKEEVN